MTFVKNIACIQRMEVWRPRAWLVGLLATALIQVLDSAGEGLDPSQRPHSRQKRLLWITTDGRLALPPGTHLTITPSLSLPFVRYPPDGFLSNMSISLPFSIDFDMLGLTDNQNPYGVLPPLLGRSLGRKAGSYFADYVAQFLERKRTARSVPPSPKHSQFHGGERALLYTIVEDLLASFGMDGKACLLRAICEVHSHSSIQKFGLVGEIVELFFSASKSPFAELLDEYVQAEVTGRQKRECWPYFKDCPKSLFQPIHNKYTNEDDTDQSEVNDLENQIDIENEDPSELKINLNQRNKYYSM
ncbi:hypothetical protein PGB90_004484 [Kerria lacca]